MQKANDKNNTNKQNSVNVWPIKKGVSNTKNAF